MRKQFASALLLFVTLGCHGVATPPETAITKHPAPVTRSAASYFEFGSTQATATYKCKLDGGEYLECRSPSLFTVGAGAHTFSIYAESEEGADPTPESHTWTVAL